ncbi:hypothetical protein XENTR_v10020299 [Xenopus tropicalis]|nr:hypothetical protein XENTR_v10020262 [Xenopus tropicalis]KAE8582813.1 hypothetical protein XENTR_v10020299 [Xenopus tropicalis]
MYQLPVTTASFIHKELFQALSVLITSIYQTYLGRWDFAYPCLFSNRSDASDETQGIREFLPAGLEHRAFRRGHKFDVGGHSKQVLTLSHGFTPRLSCSLSNQCLMLPTPEEANTV